VRILALTLLFPLFVACSGDAPEPDPHGDLGGNATVFDTPDPAPQDDPLAPARWTTEAGFRCVRSTSTIKFANDATPPQVLVITLGFPDRGRAEQTVTVDGQRLRRLHYRFGGNAWFVEIREKEGQTLKGRRRDDVHRLFSLRRALLLWPDHPEWLIDGHIGHASLGDLGSLRFDLNDEGQPTTMSSIDNEGIVYESLESIRWQEPASPGGRTWPASFDLHANGSLIWSEVIDRIETQHSLIDGFYQPAEVRRANPGGHVLNQVQHQDSVVQRIALAKGVSWESALVMGRLKAKQVESNGTDLMPGLEIELGLALEPVAVVLHRAGASDDPVEAPWVVRNGGPGRGASFESPDAIIPALLREMEREIQTAGGTAGPPRVRFAGREVGPIQVMVPSQP
jgi:hypothetical protein